MTNEKTQTTKHEFMRDVKIVEAVLRRSTDGEKAAFKRIVEKAADHDLMEFLRGARSYD